LWCTPIIPAIWKVDAGGLWVWGQPKINQWALV
jgi:hypothetical protein